ncbi:MAG: hypothetical protein B7Z59_13670 [Acidiphilium sp. 37-67-22]|nr:MAG: hypothetical protein B7X09_02360 [Acidiphilium sp. 21-66-27]OYW05428.1 MAG: hypothetical protein B7Z59_13670 [Acidiphilium sp. 37-67-22]HQT74241.1 hypothetical protein [Acidiphilium sp.]
MIDARLGLGGLVLALAATAATLALAPMPAPPPGPVAARPTPTTSPPPAAPGTAAAAQILARPLFRPDRRPVAVAADTAATGMPRLSGILRGDAVRLAIFAAPSGKPVLLGEGAHLGGYRIARIGRRAVLLEGPRGQLRLVPRFAHETGAAPHAIPPKPAADAGILVHPGPR